MLRDPGLKPHPDPEKFENRIWIQTKTPDPTRSGSETLGRIFINPYGGYPPDIHWISTLIGLKPDLDTHWPQTGGDPVDIRWISGGYPVDIHRRDL